MEYRILHYVNGKYGYKEFFELQRYNPVYKKWYVEHQSLKMVFIKSHCEIHGINFDKLIVKDIKKG